MNCKNSDTCAIAEARGAHLKCDKECGYADIKPSYTSWRITFQSSEQAARQAYEDCSITFKSNEALRKENAKLRAMIQELLNCCELNQDEMEDATHESIDDATLLLLNSQGE